MENKINIAEILKDCPKGMELDCTMFENVTFVKVDMNMKFPIEIAVSGIRSKYLTKEGCFHDIALSPESKCVIFPKGKTTWEGFHRPFKDGDVVYAIDEGNEYIFIFKEIYENERVYCYLNLKGGDLRIQEVWLTDYNPTHRLATEEEKQKLFQAIKDNGYKWNEETKTLDKLVKPKFKVGDVIQDIDIDTYKVKITAVNIEEECYEYESLIAKGIGIIMFSKQDEWELVPNKFDITTLKPFDNCKYSLDNGRTWKFAQYWYIMDNYKIDDIKIELWQD